ncbi:MAG: hypothetical protein HRU15_04965 [Planctomycetes bacterium]|nr:hypothetical protein [Planctomycetota bacterium]
MRVLIWATSLQADVLALALFLDAHEQHELLIAATGKDIYLEQPIARTKPFRSHLIDRLADDVEGIIGAFDPEVTVVDNHFPQFKTSPFLCKMWFGLGWKAPDKKELKLYFEEVTRLTGASPEEKNPYFMAQCYGPHDMAWRIAGMHIHEDNCRIVGMPFSDVLLNPPYAREQIAEHYTIDVMRRKTVLVNFTWHYSSTTTQNSVESNWLSRLLGRDSMDKNDEVFLRRLVESIIHEGANVLFCMHDKWRYDNAYLSIFYHLRAKYPNRVEVKHKDESPDNLMDLLVADVMVSNLSSFVTFFYFTGKPTVHLVPRESTTKKSLKARRVSAVSELNVDGKYMTDPDDNGGITVYSRRDCVRAIIRGLREPQCCKKRSEKFIREKMPDFVGESSAAYVEALEKFVAQNNDASGLTP